MGVMARPLRLDSADTFYHVLSRGNERGIIFRDRRDNEHFLDRVGECSERFGVEVWSYVLMVNHYHLVVRTREANLSRAMHWLGVAYSVWHNRRHERTGHLFEGRFRSFVVGDEGYLRQLALYVHRNPLRAGLVRRLADYPWSSYPCLAYGRPGGGWFDRQRTLSLFDGKGAVFREAVQDYSEEKSRLLENLRHGVFLGTAEALERLARRLKLPRDTERPATKRLPDPGSVAELTERHARALGISAKALAELRRPIRGRERPLRDVLLFLLWKTARFPLSLMADYFGVGYTSVVNARIRGQAYLSRHPELHKRLSRSNDK
jgi:putative transposase